MLQRLCLAVGLLAALGGCGAGDTLDAAIGTSFGGSYDYSALRPGLAVAPDRSVAVTVIDQRPYVVNGDESPAFVGTEYGRYRDIVEVETASDRPLASVMADAIARALDGGPGATAVPLDAGTSEAEALAALAATGADRLLLVRIHEWQTNATVRVTARWHFEATVHDRAGAQLGRRARRGSETIGTTRVQEEVGPLAVADLARRLAWLLENPSVVDALGAT